MARRTQHIAKELCEKEPYKEDLLYVKETSSFYLYDQAHNFYRMLCDEDIKHRVVMETFDEDKDLSETFVKNIIFLMGMFTHAQEEKMPMQYIAFNDCLLNLKTFKQEQFNRSACAYHKIDYNYSETKQEPKTFMKFIREVMVKKDGTTDTALVMVAQEMLGYLLVEEINEPYVFFLYGGGANGKSVLLDVIENMIGKDFTSALSLDALTTNKFAPYDLVGKRVNIVREEETKYMRIDKLKTIVSGEPIRVERKYGQGFTFVPRTKFIYGSNRIPQFADIDFGLKRRIKIIPMLRTFQQHEKDLNLTKKLLAEMPGIIGWAIDGAKRMMANNWQFTKSDALDNMMLDLQTETSSVIEFIRYNYEEVEGEYISYEDLYTSYKFWCDENGRKPKSKRNMQTEMSTFLTLDSTVGKVDGKSQRGRQLKLKEYGADV